MVELTKEGDVVVLKCRYLAKGLWHEMRRLVLEKHKAYVRRKCWKWISDVNKYIRPEGRGTQASYVRLWTCRQEWAGTAHLSLWDRPTPSTPPWTRLVRTLSPVASPYFQPLGSALLCSALVGRFGFFVLFFFSFLFSFFLNICLCSAALSRFLSHYYLLKTEKKGKVTVHWALL